MEPSATNPTGEFEPRPFDNVYLDMNGILHNSAFGVIEIVRFATHPVSFDAVDYALECVF